MIDAQTEPVQVIAQILASEMGLDPGQIMLTNEEWPIPKSKGIYIALSYISTRVISADSISMDVPDNFGVAVYTEVQETVSLDMIQIDMMSFDGSARNNKQEPIMALRSNFAQQLMGQYNMQIGRIPSSMMNASSLEETKILNRFTMTISVTSKQRKTKPVTNGYYDEFPVEATDNQLAVSPDIEFQGQNVPAIQ